MKTRHWLGGETRWEGPGSTADQGTCSGAEREEHVSAFAHVLCLVNLCVYPVQVDVLGRQPSWEIPRKVQKVAEDRAGSAFATI